MRHYDVLRNASDAPEEPDVRFYQVTTGYSVATDDPRTREIAGAYPTPQSFYDNVISLGHAGVLPSSVIVSAIIEQTWYDYLQPTYKAYPAIVAALAATKIEIEADHLKMPFPAFAVRLPEGFLQEAGGPVLHSVMAVMLKVESRGSSVPVSSIDTPPAPNARQIPVGLGSGGKMHAHVLAVHVKYIDSDGDDAYSNFSIGLDRGVTIEKSLASINRNKLPAGVYEMSEQTMHEILSLVVGVSFFATGRHKADRPILQRDPTHRPRRERRRFEKQYGQEQPAFTVGRELVLPREEGAPAVDQGTGPGEGAGRSLKFGHLRVGHLKYQAHGPGFSERKLIFVAPTVVRADLPMKPRTTPGAITDRPSRDVTEP